MTTSEYPTLNDQITIIEPLFHKLASTSDQLKKLDIVSSNPTAQHYLEACPRLKTLLQQYDALGQFVIQSLLAIGQGPVVFQDMEDLDDLEARLRSLVVLLRQLEEFYQPLGGVVGYHLTLLKLMADKHENLLKDHAEAVTYAEPTGLDGSFDTAAVRQAVRWGIEHMPELAEIYPIGGAGDRLNLQDENTDEPLPAAQLLFCGRTLLEGLVRDLQGREYLYYKLFGKQLVTPLAAMTSDEKDNHQRIFKICENAGWFSRPKESFVLFMQHLVPMLTIDGAWAMQAPLKPLLKPGGHGIIWKAAADSGVFDWLKNKGCRRALVRQINNPMAGLDNGLLILAGVGCQQRKSFGFASCERLLAAAEGMNVLVKKQCTDGYAYGITNIEYTEFAQHGISDEPKQADSAYSRFPANTNILFVDIEAIKKALVDCPIPGMIINMKSYVDCYAGKHKTIAKQAGRLESTMQNIADCMADHFPKPLSKDGQENLQTFITFNKRSKTISVAKQAYETGKSFTGTVEECFYHLMKNYDDLLTNYCGFKLPPPDDKDQYLAQGPSFIALFHPSLGGLYSVIGQKIRGGRLAKGAEWIMEVAEANIINLDLQGSLLVEADAIMGPKDAGGILVYDSERSGKCTLINVRVKNAGIEPVSGRQAWRRQPVRKEALHIILHGNAEFFAENVVFAGDMHFDVPDGYRYEVSQQGSKIVCQREKIGKATWKWNYTFDDAHHIRLSLIN